MTTHLLPAFDADLEPGAGRPWLAHLIPPVDEAPGYARVLEARVLGRPVQALCGLVLVPSRDPRLLETCTACLGIFRALTGAEGGWLEA